MLIQDPEESIVVSCCPHQEKYSFKHGSKLKQYLENCKGWVPDPSQKYTVNYIIMVLFMDLKQKNQIFQNVYNSKDYFIGCDQELQLALQSPTPLFPIEELRRKVLLHLMHNEPIFSRIYNARRRIPFWCVKELESRIAELFDDYYENKSAILLDNCQMRLNFRWGFFGPHFSRIQTWRIDN